MDNKYRKWLLTLRADEPIAMWLALRELAAAAADRNPSFGERKLARQFRERLLFHLRLPPTASDTDIDDAIRGLFVPLGE